MSIAKISTSSSEKSVPPAAADQNAKATESAAQKASNCAKGFLSDKEIISSLVGNRELFFATYRRAIARPEARLMDCCLSAVQQLRAKEVNPSWQALYSITIAALLSNYKKVGVGAK